MTGIVLCKSRDVEIAQVAASVFNMAGKERGGAGGRMGYIYSSSSNFSVQQVRYANFDLYPVFCWLTNTQWPWYHLAQWPGTSWTRIIMTGSSTHCEECFRCWALRLHHTLPWLLGTLTSRSKLSTSQVVPTVQTSNTPTNTPGSGKSSPNWCHRIKNMSLFALRCF